MSAYAQKRTEIGVCPGCDTRIRFQNKVQVGEFIICDECGDELEVMSASPIKLGWAFEDPFDDDLDYDEIFDGDGFGDASDD